MSPILPAPRRLHTAWRSGLAAALAWLALTPNPAAAAGCAPEALSCARSGGLAAGVTQFRAGNDGANHWAQANLSFVNHGSQPMTLAYVAGSGQLLDEHGNRYTVPGAGDVSGIGVAARRETDTSFVLQPGERADARFQFRWHRAGGAVTGLRFEMSMAVREATVLPGGQVKLGREHALRWQGLADGTSAGASAAATAPAVTAPAAAATAAPSDACAGQPACRDTGGFVAEAVRLVKSPNNKNRNVVRVEFRVRNTGAAPLTLGYLRDSGSLIDDRGERYIVDSRFRQFVMGIGQVTRGQADTQFQLAPGQQRSFSLDFLRYGADSGGRVFSADIVLAELQPLPGNQVRTLREHALGFTQLGAGMQAPNAGGVATDAAGAAELVQAVEGLRDLFRKK